MEQSEFDTLAVLVVEDEVLIRMDTAAIAEEAGFKVYEACHADEAIGILERHKDIRILLTDIQMPGSIDGLKLAHYVRGRWPPIRIIVVSGHVPVRDEDLPEESVFLRKPYPAVEMMGALREMGAQALRN